MVVIRDDEEDRHHRQPVLWGDWVMEEQPGINSYLVRDGLLYICILFTVVNELDLWIDYETLWRII